jgi:transposase-like protein
VARNPVQFQRGLSLGAFLAAYGTEEQCHAALVALRWPDGFVCPRCGGRRHGVIGPRRLFQCSACRHQASVKAGTVFAASKLELTKWFLAIYLMTQSKNDVAALELMRQLGVRYDTAWLVKQKLMAAMLERNRQRPLAGEVQIDDAYLGGELKWAEGGRRGRGSPNKLPFVAASPPVRASPWRFICGVSKASPRSRSAATPGPAWHPAPRWCPTACAASQPSPRPASRTR